MGSFYALLIGVGRYQSAAIKCLEAPANDAAALRILLHSRYGVPESNVGTLIDAQATRQRIHTAFRQSLIARAEPGDAVLFYFSGHGSQVPTVDLTSEPDQLDETIVPYDGRTPGVFDIRDKELGAWVTELGRRGVTNVTVILDKCHAGSGWRAADRGEAISHSAPKDERQPQPELQGWDGGPLRDSALWQPHPEHVFIAACLDSEQSYECHFTSSPDGQAGSWFSIMTYYLLRALRDPGPTATYGTLFNSMAPQVTARMSQQHPQIEGHVDRLLFDQLVLPRRQSLTITRILGDQLTLSGGLLHGLSTGLLLDLNTPGRPDDSIGTALVKETSIDRATAQLQAAADTTKLRVGVEAHVAGGDYGVRQRSVAVEGTGELANAIREALQGDQPYSKLVIPEIGSELRVVVDSHKVWICGASRDDVLVRTVPGPDVPASVSRYLWHIVRFRNALEMNNPASMLNGCVRLRLRDTHGLLPIDKGGGYQLRSGDEIWVEVENDSERNLCVTLFDFNPSYGIARLYPYAGQMHETFRPHTSAFAIGLRGPREPLPIWLPEGRQQGDDYLKLFVTTGPVTYLDVLEQSDLDQAPLVPRSSGVRASGGLVQLIDEAITGRPSALSIRAVDDWCALQVRCTARAR